MRKTDATTVGSSTWNLSGRTLLILSSASSSSRQNDAQKPPALKNIDIIDAGAEAELRSSIIGLPAPYATDISKQMLKGLSHLAQNRYLHTDVKPENTVIFFNGSHRKDHGQMDNDGLFHEIEGNNECPLYALAGFMQRMTIKIADMGEAKTEKEMALPQDKGNIQPPSYRAPEVMLGLWPLKPAIDVWSMAVTMGMLFTGRSWLGEAGGDTGAVMQEIQRVVGPIPWGIVEETRHIWKKSFPDLQQQPISQLYFSQTQAPQEMTLQQYIAAKNQIRPDRIKRWASNPDRFDIKNKQSKIKALRIKDAKYIDQYGRATMKPVNNIRLGPFSKILSVRL